MKRSEAEFIGALRKVGLSKSICESVNNIRKVIFEESSPEESLSFEEIVEKYNETHDRSLFDRVGRFYEGYAIVELGERYNFIDKDGNLLWKGETWFDLAYRFRKGYAAVRLNGKWNFIDKKGNPLWKGAYWFDVMSDFEEEGYIRVKRDGRWNFINKNGNLISPELFDYVHPFRNGYAKVELDEKYNFIDKDGNLLWKGEEWFDRVSDFNEGYAKVKLGGKRYKIDTEGNLHEY